MVRLHASASSSSDDDGDDDDSGNFTNISDARIQPDHGGTEGDIESSTDQLRRQDLRSDKDHELQEDHDSTTAVSTISPASYHDDTSGFTTADSNFRPNLASFGQAMSDRRLVPRQMRPFAHAAEKFPAPVAVMEADSTHSKDNAKSTKQIPSTMLTTRGNSLEQQHKKESIIADALRHDVARIQHDDVRTGRVRFTGIQLQQVASKTRATFDIESTDGTQLLCPEREDTKESGKSNSVQLKPSIVMHPGAIRVIGRDGDASSGPEIDDGRLMEADPTGRIRLDAPDSEDDDTEYSTTLRDTGTISTLSTHPGGNADPSNGNQEIAVINADVEADRGAVTSERLPVVADLAPDTDKIVQQAIEEDRAQQDVEHLVLVESEPIDEAGETRRARNLRCGLVALCLIVVVTAITLGVILSKGDGGGDTANGEPLIADRTDAPTMSVQPSSMPSATPTIPPSLSPSTAPSEQPTLSNYDALVQRLVAATNGSLSVFHDMLSPQSRAAHWLLEDTFFAIADAAVGDTTGNNTSSMSITDTVADNGTPSVLAFEWNETSTKLVVERYAAVVFYYALGGEMWDDQLNFLSNASICDWTKSVITRTSTRFGVMEVEHIYGIACTSSTHPQRINFGSHHEDMLTGRLPTEIGLFQEAYSFTLESQPRIRGTIPTELGNLKELYRLNLSLERLEGTIPTEVATLPSLESLILSNTMLSGQISFNENDFTSLRYLYLDDTAWDSIIPRGIEYLTQLRHLSMLNTAMRGIIPTEIGKLTSLERLVLGACRILGSIPTEIGEMTSLKHLDFEYSYFLSGKLPSELGRLVALTHLNVACTDIDGMIPDTLTNLTQLRDFDISGSSLTGGIPQDFCSQTSDVPGTFADLEIANCGAKKREEFAVVTFPPNINCTQLDETDPTNVLNCCGCASNDVGEVVRDCSNSRSCYSRLT